METILPKHRRTAASTAERSTAEERPLRPARDEACSEKIASLTAHDYPSGQFEEAAGIDMIEGEEERFGAHTKETR